MRRPALFTLLTLLSGCVSYQAQPLAPTDMLARYEQRTLQAAPLNAYIQQHLPGSAGAWNLNTLTLAAYYFSPELDAARAKLANTEAAIETAGQRPNPSLSLPTQYAAGDIKPWTYGLGLDIPLETAGKRGYRIAQAEQLSSAARLSIEQTAWQIRSQLHNSLIDLFASQQRAALLQQQLALQQQIVSLLEQQQAQGASAASAVNQQRLVLAQDQSDLATNARQRLDAYSQIAQTIGIPLDAIEQTPIELSEFQGIKAEIPQHDVRRQSILNRIDVRIALAEYETSQAALQLEIARQYPNLSLGMGYSFDQGVNKYSFSPAGISLPIFNRNEGPIAEAETLRRQAAIHVEALQDQALNEADSALQGYSASLQSLTASEMQLTSQAALMQSAQRALALGATDRLELTRQQRNNNTAALARIDAAVQVQHAISRLENAMQRPLENLPLTAPPSKETPQP